MTRVPTVFDRLQDRSDAGRRLGVRLAAAGLSRPVVLGIPRGGVVVAVEIAAALSAPVDVLVVRKVGLPSEPEYGVGAVAEGGVVVLDERRILAAGLRIPDLADAVRREQEEVADRSRRFRAGGPPIPLGDGTAVIVDDGVATGGTIEAAATVARRRGARRVVVAIGVAPPEVLPRLRSIADAVEVALLPTRFEAVGQWYHRFEPIEDEEVLRLLALSGKDRAAAREAGPPSAGPARKRGEGRDTGR